MTTTAQEPAALPGEVWRVSIRDTVCAVMPDEIRVWWRGAWDVVPLSASERNEVLRSWAQHERARAEKAERSLCHVCWSMMMGLEAFQRAWAKTGVGNASP